MMVARCVSQTKTKSFNLSSPISHHQPGNISWHCAQTGYHHCRIHWLEDCFETALGRRARETTKQNNIHQMGAELTATMFWECPVYSPRLTPQLSERAPLFIN